MDGTAKVEELEYFIRVSDRSLGVEAFAKLLHENVRHVLIHVVGHDRVTDVASHDVEDSTRDLVRYGAVGSTSVEVNNGLESRLDAEFPHRPGLRTSKFANIGKSLVDVAERELEVFVCSG